MDSSPPKSNGRSGAERDPIETISVLLTKVELGWIARIVDEKISETPSGKLKEAMKDLAIRLRASIR